MSEQKENKLTPKMVYALALLKKGYEKEGQPQIPQKVFANNTNECKDNGIIGANSLIALWATFPNKNLATKQKITYNEKIVTAYIPL